MDLRYDGRDGTQGVDYRFQCYDQGSRLSNRRNSQSYSQYAERALEYYRLMQMKNIPIDSDTIVCTLKACSKSGDVKTAVDVIKTMNERGIQANKYIYNLIIRVYSGACNLETVDIDLCAKYVEDAWKIFNEAAAKQMVT